ncbi:hypothetical protein TWF730_003078 [Orbilia blumenaviensis]|uniref:Uncharacterized protein n=1 Tax=Orbilia blumenaviensis TaxID=1796055 RepID=A0AAV9U4F5_9PEZI
MPKVRSDPDAPANTTNNMNKGNAVPIPLTEVLSDTKANVQSNIMDIISVSMICSDDKIQLDFANGKFSIGAKSTEVHVLGKSNVNDPLANTLVRCNTEVMANGSLNVADAETIEYAMRCMSMGRYNLFGHVHV